ncbi:MAG TPA: GNAT family N-acetyltransferase, partial [Methylomirabilota bacterium]|nr:GNAT family N-acetyltransferase [Methylomirabilota bacterium]
ARRAYAAASARGRCRAMIAEDAAGARHAGALVVWDSTAAYYLLGGGDPELRASGAASLLLWEAIRGAATTSDAFDFCGSMKRPIERFFRSFGARQTPFLEVTKTPARLLRTARAARDALT